MGRTGKFFRSGMVIADDDANIDDCTFIVFFDTAEGITKWGLKDNSEKVKLYALRFLASPGEKPWYEIDHLVYIL